jgi:hypothetical protein
VKVPLSLKIACLLFLLIPAAWAQSLGTTNPEFRFRKKGRFEGRVVGIGIDA